MEVVGFHRLEGESLQIGGNKKDEKSALSKRSTLGLRHSAVYLADHIDIKKEVLPSAEVLRGTELEAESKRRENVRLAFSLENHTLFILGEQ